MIETKPGTSFHIRLLHLVCIHYHMDLEAAQPRESIELGAGPFLLGASYGYRDAFAKSEHNH